MNEMEMTQGTSDLSDIPFDEYRVPSVIDRKKTDVGSPKSTLDIDTTMIQQSRLYGNEAEMLEPNKIPFDEPNNGESYDYSSVTEDRTSATIDLVGAAPSTPNRSVASMKSTNSTAAESVASMRSIHSGPPRSIASVLRSTPSRPTGATRANMTSPALSRSSVRSNMSSSVNMSGRAIDTSFNTATSSITQSSRRVAFEESFYSESEDESTDNSHLSESVKSRQGIDEYFLDMLFAPAVQESAIALGESIQKGYDYTSQEVQRVYADVKGGKLTFQHVEAFLRNSIGGKGAFGLEGGEPTEEGHEMTLETLISKEEVDEEDNDSINNVNEEETDMEFSETETETNVAQLHEVQEHDEKQDETDEDNHFAPVAAPELLAGDNVSDGDTKEDSKGDRMEQDNTTTVTNA